MCLIKEYSPQEHNSLPSLLCPVLPFIQVSSLFCIVCIVTGGLGLGFFFHLEDVKYRVRQELLAVRSVQLFYLCVHLNFPQWLLNLLAHFGHIWLVGFKGITALHIFLKIWAKIEEKSCSVNSSFRLNLERDPGGNLDFSVLCLVLRHHLLPCRE